MKIKENHKKSTRLYSVGDGDDYDPVSQWLTEITSIFPFKNFHGQESLEVIFGQHCVHHLPRWLAFWLKATFVSAKIYFPQGLIFEWWAAGPEFGKKWTSGKTFTKEHVENFRQVCEVQIKLFLHYSDVTQIPLSRQIHSLSPLITLEIESSHSFNISWSQVPWEIDENQETSSSWKKCTGLYIGKSTISRLLPILMPLPSQK